MCCVLSALLRRSGQCRPLPSRDSPAKAPILWGQTEGEQGRVWQQQQPPPGRWRGTGAPRLPGRGEVAPPELSQFQGEPRPQAAAALLVTRGHHGHQRAARRSPSRARAVTGMIIPAPGPGKGWKERLRLLPGDSCWNPAAPSHRSGKVSCAAPAELTVNALPLHTEMNLTG